jgi:hypothetical protein
MTATATEQVGYLDVLSVGRGHLRISADPNDAESVEKIKSIVSDMLKRGASIFIELDNGETKRVKRFNPTRMTYLIDESDVVDALHGLTTKKEVPVATAKATVVGRTAGG